MGRLPSCVRRPRQSLDVGRHSTVREKSYSNLVSSLPLRFCVDIQFAKGVAGGVFLFRKESHINLLPGGFCRRTIKGPRHLYNKMYCFL